MTRVCGAMVEGGREGAEGIEGESGKSDLGYLRRSGSSRISRSWRLLPTRRYERGSVRRCPTDI